MSLLDNASLLLTPNAYKEGKLYSVIPSNGNGDFTATRATTATRVNSAGLVDLVPYNIVRYSEMFADASWLKTSITVTANTSTAPDNTLTADTLNITTSSGFIRQTLNISSGISYNYSAYVKKSANTANNLFRLYYNSNLGSPNNGEFRAVVDLTNLTITTTPLGTLTTGRPTILSSTLTDVGNGWYRASVAFTTGTAAGNTSAEIGFQANTTAVEFLAWGAQLVEGISARDYLRTETRLNIPRLDYSLGGCPNILLEPQRTNLALQSSSFDSVSWSKLNGSVTANTTTSPSGIVDADKIVEDATNNFHGVVQSIPTTLGVTYNVSFYAKASERGYIQWNTQANTDFANFDLINGVVGTSLGVSNHQIQSVGNGWYRCSLNFVAPLTGTTGFFRLVIITSASAARLQTYVGNGTSGLFVWGAQFEQGAYATSYIPTTTASVTRNADSITRNNIFTNGLITAAGGTWFVELKNNRVYTRDSSANGLSLNSVSGGNFQIRAGAASARILILKTDLGVNSIIYTTLTDTVKIAIKWNGSTADVFVNGVKVVSATAFNTTLLQELAATGGDVPKYINEMALFPTPLTDAQCLALTA